jgi:GWxTD domain-containing protein
VRSSSICSATARRWRPRLALPALLAAVAACGLLCLACASGGSGAVAAMADLTNPFLGPDYSAWLIGPVARIARPEEIKAYLALHDDGEAATFIQQFWARRSSGKGPPALALFEERAAVADKRYSEAGLLGRRTDRGTIFILYGHPARGGFEVAPRPSDPPIEVWEYGATAPAGLDGKPPDRFYRFTKRGDLTVLYVPRPGTRLAPPVTPP